jgi:hypothetical protein
MAILVRITVNLYFEVITQLQNVPVQLMTVIFSYKTNFHQKCLNTVVF